MFWLFILDCKFQVHNPIMAFIMASFSVCEKCPAKRKYTTKYFTFFPETFYDAHEAKIYAHFLANLFNLWECSWTNSKLSNSRSRVRGFLIWTKFRSPSYRVRGLLGLDCSLRINFRCLWSVILDLLKHSSMDTSFGPARMSVSPLRIRCCVIERIKLILNNSIFV